MAIILNPVKGTVLKKSPTNTPDRHLIESPIKIRWWQPSSNNHLLVCVDEPFKGFHNWHVYAEHCAIFEDGVQVHPAKTAVGQAVRLKVPFWPQTDNRFEPMRTCNTSSCAMAAKFLGAKINSDDEYYQIVRKFGDTTSQQAQSSALLDIGINSQWHTNLDFADLDKSLGVKLPMVLGILHRSSLQNPTGGHMITLIGKNEDGYIFHDPYGSLLDGYSSDVRRGEAATYSRTILRHRWTVEGKNSGWGRTFYKN